MKRLWKNTLILAATAAAIGTVLALKEQSTKRVSGSTDVSPPRVAHQAVPANLPALVDLGAGKCIPCKMMAPILEELKEEYAGQFSATFHDVWENPDTGKAYNIRLIPTQVFLDPDGNELFRHEGFYSKEDILAKWKELGFDMNPGDA